MRAFELVLVGGGLANGLVALAVAHRRPDARIAVIERSATLGGNHTWCFHGGDLAPRDSAWIDPLIVRRWNGYRVAFPGLERRLDSAYACVTSEQLHHVVTATLSRMPSSSVLLGTEVASVTAASVQLADGRVLTGDLVVDARGPESATTITATGYQKFFGLEVELAAPHRYDEPIVIDATVDQHDGFHFLYVLPFGTTRLLLEDTYFSDSPELDHEASRDWLLAEVARRGLRLRRVLRHEHGVLPLPWSEAPRPGTSGDDSPFLAGWKGGWFHPVTGYSFPIAARVARVIAESAASTRTADLSRLAADHWQQVRFAHLLNWMFFRLYAPADRTNVLERFYGLPDDTIRRFYALQTTAADRARILCGRPPRGLSIRRLLQGERPTTQPEQQS